MENALTVNDFVEKYITAIKSRLRSHVQRAHNLNRIVRFFDNRPVSSIKRNDIELYCESRLDQGITSGSINVEIALLSAAINYANVRWEMTLVNPVTGLYFPARPGRLRYLEKPEVMRLIDETRKMRCCYLPDFMQIALNTGARKNELLQLKITSVDLQRSILTIEGHTTKTGKRRYLPINQTARQALENRLQFRNENCPESPWIFCKRNGERVKSPEKSFNLAVARSGIIDFHVHDLRHTFASWLVSEGVELIKVRDLLGHSTIRMTERYAHLAPNKLHDAVAVLDGFYPYKQMAFEV